MARSKTAAAAAAPVAPKTAAQLLSDHLDRKGWNYQQICDKVTRATEVLAKFADKLAADPLYAFAWGEEPMRAAAEKTVWMEVLVWYTNGDNYTKIVERLNTESIRLTQYYTAGQENTKVYKAAAYAKAADDLKWLARDEQVFARDYATAQLREAGW